MSDPLGILVPLDLATWRYRQVVIPLGSLPFDASRLQTSRVVFRTLDRRQNFGTSATVDGSGNLSFTLPKDAAVFRFLPANRERGYIAWDGTAQLDGNAAQTIALIRSSPCTLYRSETPA